MPLKTLQQLATHYQKRFAYDQSPGFQLPIKPKLKVVVIIPCYDEEPEYTLASLSKCKVDTDRLEVLLIFNHASNVDEAVRLKHEQQLVQFQSHKLDNGIEISAIAAFDLPPKHAGVGLARKIGMDIALQQFALIGHDGLIVNLDADCCVSNNYFEQLLRIEKENINGLSIAFDHDVLNIEDQDLKERIVDYENWLRYYVNALRFTAYPHAFHTIGSSMATRASAYAKIGGMNRRKAGEDFYFLHKLIPQQKFYDLTSCIVFPSARNSDRVPFGTGRAMMEMEAGTKEFKSVYHPQIFIDIRLWLNQPELIFEMTFKEWPDFISLGFEELGWFTEIQALKKRSTSLKTFQRNFFFWMDGFKMLKLVHYGRDQHYGLMDVQKASSKLLNLKSNSTLDLMEQFRDLDRSSAFAYF